jgi:hypothetical protein
MGCIESLPYEIVLRGGSFKEIRDYILKNYKEHRTVQPGFKVFDTHIIGIPPISIALDGDFVIFPFTKPCHGTFLLRVEDADEASRLRALNK